VELAQHIAKWLLEMEPDNAAGYVLLLNIYAAAANRHLCENVEQQRKGEDVKQQAGYTWIEVNNMVHKFVVEDQDHPQMIEIHAELLRLSGHIHDAGMCLVQNLFCMMWKKRNRCVTIVTNWLWHLGSSTQLLVLLSK
jgi:hypothetical protein